VKLNTPLTPQTVGLLQQRWKKRDENESIALTALTDRESGYKTSVPHKPTEAIHSSELPAADHLHQRDRWPSKHLTWTCCLSTRWHNSTTGQWGFQSHSFPFPFPTLSRSSLSPNSIVKHSMAATISSHPIYGGSAAKQRAIDRRTGPQLSTTVHL